MQLNSTQIPVEMQDEVKTNTPLTYDNMCKLVGELFIDSWLKIRAVQEDAQSMGVQMSQMVTDLKTENAELKRTLEDLNNGPQSE